MAVVANTFQSTSAVGNREQLSDVVSRITPEDTPIYSLISKGKVQAPVRVAVTGRTVGPPLFESLEVLGRDETIRRLNAAKERL